MACCSKDPSINREVQNDSEVEAILSRDCDEILPDLKEKPMSPILSTSIINRKHIMGSRSKRKKSRVKLTDRFTENDRQKDNSIQINTSDTVIPEFFEDTFTLSQNECLINRIEKLEEIESYRQNIYKIMVTRDTNGDFCFKKPISPVPNKGKKNKVTPCENSLDIVESENNTEPPSEVSKNKQIDLVKCSGFQTATGKTIPVSETDIKKHSRLFEDIINPSQNCYTDRNKKYAFLSKSKSTICIKQDNFNDVKSVLSENDVSVKKLTRNKLNNTQIKKVEKFAENNFIIEQLGNITINNTQEKFENPRYSETFTNKICVNPQISLTQEIYESGISNTQMLCAVNDVLSSVDNNKNNEVSSDKCDADFKGFDKKDATESHEFFQRLISIFQSLKDFTNKQMHKNHNRKSIFCINDTLGQEEVFKKNELNYRKHVITDLPLPPKKRIRSCSRFECIANEDMNGAHIVQNKEIDALLTKKSDFGGFSSASGISIKISENSMNKARNVFIDIDLNLDENNLLSKRNDVNIKNGTLNLPNNCLGGFSSASGKSIRISDSSLKKARSIFDSIDLDPSKENLINLPRVCQTTSSGKLKLYEAEKNIQQAGNEAKLDDIKIADFKLLKNNSVEGFSCAVENIMKVQNTPLRRVKNIFDDFDLKFPDTNQPLLNFDVSTTCGFQTAGGSKLRISEIAIRKAERDFNNIEQEAKGTEVITPIKSSDLSTSQGSKSNITHSKRRLGVSFCKQIQIPDSKLNRAKLLFEEDLYGNSPVRPRSSTTYTSTPVRQNSCSTPIRNDLLQSSKSFSDFIDVGTITPIKINVIEAKKGDFSLTPDSKITLSSPTKGNAFDWINDLEVERRKLEDRLKIVVERQKALENRSEEKLGDNKRPRKGILYQSKITNTRISLNFLVKNQKRGEADTKYDLFHINPQNAENVHFKEHHSSTVTTRDGAIVIPNSKDIIGLSEIENAFNLMPGVESRLIPNGWLRNHYKWIIWKLASYERMFPIQLGGCLCVENVVQQLKYRYDREIDRAERSALRKIYEKDDAPQKRMILCVSDIKKVNINKYELELSDGWYGIRTVIDEPLCNQVFNGKIKIGTKLVIIGAELLNCDGCYPLESTNLTCLRINFNSTRRAIWHAKLGFQSYPGPFPIQIHSVHPLGGLIGALRICIVRVYPFNYFERSEGYSVWRNKKAEEMRAQEWDNERYKKLEQIQENVSKNLDYFQDKQNINLGKEYKNISEITCSKTLYEVMKNSKDPDCIQEMLSSSQRRAILDYQNNLSIKKQEEMAAKVNEDVQRLKLTKRNVVAVLKLLIIDANCRSDKAFNFFVWGPTESHTQILREGTFVTVQNVLAKKNGDLNSNIKTTYKPELSSNNLCNRFRRRLVQIIEFTKSDFSSNFNEFDTVGVVVQTKIGLSSQQIWLTDNSGRLLLVNIYEGPSTCLLLDNLKRGQATTVCNLTYLGLKDDVVQALANHFTIFSSYSQHRHLQEGLDSLKKELPKNMENILSDCDSKIELFRIQHTDIKNSFCKNFEDSDEDTLVSSRITSTDVALSLIDLDKFN